MTEAEWLVGNEPEKMLEFLRGKASGRKLRLFGCACCRRVWHLLTDHRSRRAIEVAEQFADGNRSKQELANAWESAGEVSPAGHGSAARHNDWHNAHSAAWYLAEPDASDAAQMVSGATAMPASLAASEVADDAADIWRAWRAARQKQIAVLHDIIGNPFCPVSLDPAWLAWHGSAVVKLALAVYEEPELSSGHLDAGRLAVLADMLEEAGATDPQLLGHLRGPGPHVRGCHIVDLLLGKA